MDNKTKVALAGIAGIGFAGTVALGVLYVLASREPNRFRFVIRLAQRVGMKPTPSFEPRSEK